MEKFYKKNKYKPFRFAPGNHGLAMAEIIFAIGVLAVVSMFIIQMFVKATNLEHKAYDLDTASEHAQTIIEKYKAFGIFNETEFFDSDWNQTNSFENDGFTISTTVTNQDGVNHISVLVKKNSPYLLENGGEQVVYSLSGAALEELQ